jgi:endonuclease YncB( thermonuclease family)
VKASRALAVLSAIGLLMGPGLLPLPALAQSGGGGAPVIGTGAAKEGDVVTVNGQEFRLDGIDAPDVGQRCKNVRGAEYDCFELSRKMLERIINNDEVTCTPKKEQGSKPPLAVCMVRGVDMGRAMVQLGYALAYRALSFTYDSDEAVAMSFRRGMWAGRVEPPWEWRSRQIREKAKRGG